MVHPFYKFIIIIISQLLLFFVTIKAVLWTLLKEAQYLEATVCNFEILAAYKGMIFMKRK